MFPGEPGAETSRRTSASSTEDDQCLGDRGLIEALRRGDEDAFTSLIEQYHPSLVRLAMVFVGDRAVAEEVAQDAWLGVLQGIDRFEGRSSIKTWIFTILSNRARTKGKRESRSIPFSALTPLEERGGEPAMDPERFRPAGDRWEGGWISFPRAWDDLPEDRLVSRETRAQIMAAIAGLPANQRMVITLRDVEGWPAQEVCNVLRISETNQRVLLHRARSKVRQGLEAYFETE